MSVLENWLCKIEKVNSYYKLYGKFYTNWCKCSMIEIGLFDFFFFSYNFYFWILNNDHRKSMQYKDPYLHGLIFMLTSPSCKKCLGLMSSSLHRLGFMNEITLFHSLGFTTHNISIQFGFYDLRVTITFGLFL